MARFVEFAVVGGRSSSPGTDVVMINPDNVSAVEPSVDGRVALIHCNCQTNFHVWASPAEVLERLA